MKLERPSRNGASFNICDLDLGLVKEIAKRYK